MKCINNHMKKRISSFLVFVFLLSACFTNSGCGKKSVTLSYSELSDKSVFSCVETDKKDAVIHSVAENYCVSATDVAVEGIDAQMVNAVGLFDLKHRQVLFASRLHERFYPASITKVLTAYIVLKDVEGGKLSLDTPVPIGPNTVIRESGVAACAFNQGDVVTVEQALYVMIVRSDNGAAVALAELAAGSVEAFAERMNTEAVAIGATNSHFVNPNGLNNAEHYSTAYDLYLILSKAMDNTTFTNIFQTKEYETNVVDNKGGARTISCTATNRYARGTEAVPEGVLFIGGKTGTTKAAGNCLIIYTTNGGGDPYISVVLGAQDQDTLYLKMGEMLQLSNIS